MPRPRRGRQEPRTGGDSGESDLYSRCSPLYFHNGIEEINRKMTFKHGEAIKSTPFASYFSMPKFSSGFARIEAVLRRFNLRTTSIIVGSDIDIPFTARDFSIVMGLQHVGQPVDLDLRMESCDIVTRIFSGKFNSVTRVEIYKKLIEYVDKHSEEDLRDFARLYILFVFNCILFPMSNYSTPRFLLPYVDDLAGIGMYAWGEAAYNFLVDEIDSHLGGANGDGFRKKYFDGCTIGMMAWIYECMPSLGSARTLRSFPRFFRWGESKIPNSIAVAEAKFSQVTRNKVKQIIPLPEEERLLSLVQQPVEVPKNDTAIFEAILKEKDNEIKQLRERISSLEGKATEEKMEVNVEEDLEADEEWKAKFVLDENVHDESLEKTSPGDNDGKEEVDERSGVAIEPSSPPQEDADLLDDVVSSIVKDVQARHDRIKKRKDEDFVTPPGTTTPSKKPKEAARKGRTRQNKVLYSMQV